jgi:hypothetical protein
VLALLPSVSNRYLTGLSNFSCLIWHSVNVLDLPWFCKTFGLQSELSYHSWVDETLSGPTVKKGFSVGSFLSGS